MRLVWSVITISLFVVFCTQAKRNFRLRKHHVRSRQDIEKQEARNEDRGEEDRNVTKVYDTVHKYHGKKRHSTSAKRHDLGLLSGLDQAHLGGGDHHMNGLNGVATADVGANADSPSVGYLDAAHGITAALHGQKLQVGSQAMPAHHPEEDGLNPLSVYHKRDPIDHTQDSNVAGFVDNHAISLSANGHTVDGHTLNSEIGDQTVNIPTSITAGHALGGHVGGLVGHVSDGNMQIADDTVVSSPHLETSAQSQQLSAAQEGAAWLQHQQGTMNVAHPEGALLHSDHHTSHNLGTVGHIGTFGHIDTVGHIDAQPQALGHHVENYMQGSEELEHHLANQRPIVISHPPIHITKNHHHHTFHDVEDQGTVEYHPCINGGVYVPTSAHSYECICPEQYIGKNCQDMNHCHPCPCKNKGRCHNIADLPKYKCTCPAGFYGQQCAMKDPCHPNPCKNNGKCAHDGKGNIECVCPLRFKGTRCEDLHSCKPNPCLNSGMCLEKDGKGKFECQCTEQYRGTICSKSRFCYQNPCQNGGVCQEDHDNFNCICIHGWRGRICEERACKPNPCKNGATCSETADGKDFKCICLPWHSGRLCEENRPCLTKPCMNGGKCIDSFSGFHWSYGPLQFYCICKAPYTGERCEIHGCRNCHKNAHCESDKCVCDEGYTGNGKTCIKKADPCHPNPCENEGICVQKGETEEFECKCKKPYLPPYCKLRDVCDPNPCKNEAQCVPGGDGSYTCVCPPGFKGPDCDKTDACLPNPCQHGGTCRDENGTAKCECKGAWAPPLCKECSCPKKNLPGVPDITCDSEGKCVCPPGFIMDILMKICKKEKKGGGSPCTSTPCINGGECLDQGSTYVCRCKPPYLGKDCQIKDPCNPNPCNNNGKCKSDKATEKFLGCDCPPKFPVQPFCDLKDVPVKGVCEPNPCKNAGRCMPAGKSYDCICTDRFTGPTCAIDKCANCDENAACMGGKCKCKAGFIGNGYECIRDTPTCEQKCPQYSTCVIPTGNCQCNPGYTFVDRICLPLSSGEGEEETSETVKPTEKPTVTDEPMTTAAASTVPLTKDNSGGGGQPITTNPATIKPTTIPITKPTGGSPIPPKTNPTSKPPAPTEEGQGAEPNMGNKPPPQAPQPTSLPQTKPSPATPTPPPKGPPAPPPSNSKGGSPSGPPGPPGSSSSSSGGPPAPPSSSSSSGGSPGPPGSSKGGAAPPGAKPSEESGSPAPPSGLKAGSAGPPGGSKGGSAGPPGPPGSSSAGAAGPPGPPSGSKGGSPGPPGPPGSSTKSFIKNKYRQRLLNDKKTGQDDNSEFDFAIR